jgi:hypothetical protein
MFGVTKGAVTDPNGYDFVNGDSDVSGVASTMLQLPSNAFTEATEIKAGDSVSVTIRYHSLQSRTATAGQCGVTLEFLTGNDFNNGYGKCELQTLIARMDAE